MNKKIALGPPTLFAAAILLTVFSSAAAAVRPDAAIQSELKALFEHPPEVAGFPFQELAASAAEQYGLPVAYILAVVRGESYFDPSARSHKGALGLMQVMPSTAADYGVGAKDLLDPVFNVDVGAHYLADLYYSLQDPYLALAAYYCGPGKVDKARFVLRADCNEYVLYIHAHLKKVLGQRSAPHTLKPSSAFTLTRFDNYLDAQAFIQLMRAQLTGVEWDVLRKEQYMQDHARYRYNIVVTPGAGRNKEAFCQQVQKKTGFLFCR